MIIDLPGPPTIAEIRRALAEISSVTPARARQMVAELARLNAATPKPYHSSPRRSRRGRL